MRKRLHVRHLLIYQIHDLIKGLEHIQAFKVLALRDLRVQRGVEVEDRRVHAPNGEELFALEAGLRDVLRQAVAVDARSYRHAELARVGEAHWFTAAGLLCPFCSQRLLGCVLLQKTLGLRDMMRGRRGRRLADFCCSACPCAAFLRVNATLASCLNTLVKELVCLWNASNLGRRLDLCVALAHRERLGGAPGLDLCANRLGVRVPRVAAPVARELDGPVARADLRALGLMHAFAVRVQHRRV